MGFYKVTITLVPNRRERIFYVRGEDDCLDRVREVLPILDLQHVAIMPISEHIYVRATRPGE